MQGLHWFILSRNRIAAQCVATPWSSSHQPVPRSSVSSLWSSFSWQLECFRTAGMFRSLLLARNWLCRGGLMKSLVPARCRSRQSCQETEVRFSWSHFDMRCLGDVWALPVQVNSTRQHPRSFITSITATMSSLRKARDDNNKIQMTLFRFFNQRNLSQLQSEELASKSKDFVLLFAEAELQRSLLTFQLEESLRGSLWQSTGGPASGRPCIRARKGKLPCSNGGALQRSILPACEISSALTVIICAVCLRWW